MKRTLWYGLLTAAVALILAGCGSAPAAAPAPAQPTGEAMMEPTGEAMMEPTGEAMPHSTGEAMMEPTGEAMMDSTGEAMPHSTGEAMMEPTGEAMMDSTGEAMTEPTGEAMMEPTGEAMMQAPWLALPLTDVRTGETFTLADFAGRPVYVETMATWCSNCRAQLASVQQAVVTLKDQPPVFVALSVETTLPPAQLAQYAAANGFEPIFAVASPELLQGLADSFGRTITNPPSTPHFLIMPDGSHGELMTGYSSAERIVELLQAASAGA